MVFGVKSCPQSKQSLRHRKKLKNNEKTLEKRLTFRQGGGVYYLYNDCCGFIHRRITTAFFGFCTAPRGGSFDDILSGRCGKSHGTKGESAACCRGAFALSFSVCRLNLFSGFSRGVASIALLFNRNAFEKCGERAGFRVLQVSRESVFCLLRVSLKWRFWRLPVAAGIGNAF